MFETLFDLMEKVNDLQDLYETSIATDDRWTAGQCLLELEEVNKKLDALESKEH